MRKKILAGLLSLAMVFSMMPTAFVSAEEANTSTQVETQVGNKVIKALQSRINALPTVDEFIALADGTTVEDSTLNQAQLDVYNEAQAIADEMDKLTDEEQGHLDTGKLEALFEYFNGMTGEMATTISPVTSGTKYINSGGTYTLKGGRYTTSSVAITINTTDAVTLNIVGDITATASDSAFILATSGSNVTINGNGYKVDKPNGSNVVANKGTVKLNNCIFTSVGVTIGNYTTMYVQSGSYSRTGSSGQVFSNADGTLYIQGGTITNVSGTNDAVAGGNVYMTGGTVSAPNGGAIRLSQDGTKAEITGGTISGSTYGVYLKSENPTCKIGNVTFSGNTNDVYLASGHTFTLSTDYTGSDKIKVGVADTISANKQRQITTTSTDQGMLAKVISANSNYIVKYNSSSKYLYLWKHSHTWSYSASGNTVTAKCTSDSNCGYASGLKLTLTAPDATYSGKSYEGASVENNISSVTGASAGSIKYVGRGETSYTESTTAPTDAGTYTAKVTIGGATATADFTINKADIKPTVSLADWVYGKTASTPDVKGNEGNGEVTYSYKKQDAEDSTYTEVTDFSTIPVGNYTLKASIAESANYNANEATCNFAVTKQPITVSVSMEGWEYGDTAKTPSVTVKVEDSDITSSYEKSQIIYTYYTDEDCTNKTTSADGAATDGAAPKNAGRYYVKAEVSETNNHAAGSGKKEFTIEKKEIGIEWSGDSFTYNGKTQTPTATATGLLDGDTCTITVTGGQKDTNAKAGNEKYTATADAVDNTNYKLPVTGTTHEFTITPAELTVTWTDTELTYNGSEQTPTAELNGLMEGDTCDVTVTGGKTDTNVKSQQGTYTAEAECTDKNYVVNEQGKATEFTITPKDIEDAEIELTPGDQIHNGNEITQTVSRVTVDGKNLAEGSDYKIDDSSILTATDFGTYTVTVTGTGNYKGSFSKEWKIKDENPPTGEISIAENKWTEFLNNITFGHFFKETQTVTIKADDKGSGVDKVYYYNSNEALQEDAVKALADDKWTEIANGGSYSVDAENNYVVYAKITDKSGNVTYISSEGFAIDKTAPKITGVEAGKTYCIEKEIAVTDDNLDVEKVTVNGKNITPDASGSGKYILSADTSESASVEQKYKISAEDKAGNKTELTITLRKSHDEVPYKDVEATCTKDGHTGGSYCSVCGEVINAPKVDKATGHQMPADWTIEKEATTDEEGLQSKTCEREGCRYKMYQSIPAIGTTDIGSLDKYAEVAPEVPVEKALFGNKKSELTASDSKIFDNSDKQDIADGKKSAKVWLEISKTDEEKILAEEKSEIQKKAVENVGSGAKVSYFDADLFAQVGDADKKKVSEPGIDIEVKITIPYSLLNHSSSMVRDYKIIRLHKDEKTGKSEISVLEGVFDSKTNEFTFKTDRFSTYAIAYNDRYIGGGSSGGSSGSLWTPAPEPTVTPSATPTAKPEESTTPSAEPTTKPSAEPTTKPGAEPTTKPSVKPTATPVVKPSARPVISEAEKEKNGLSLNEKLKVDQNGSKIIVSWGGVKGAAGYKVYAQYCGSSFTKKSLNKTVKGSIRKCTITKINGKKLNLKKNYKLYVEAYKLVKGKEVSLGRTITAHIVGLKNSRETNVKAVKLTKTSYKLSVGKKVTIKGSTVLVDKTKKPLSDNHAKELRFATSNKNVAIVSEKGVIKAVGKGTCTIYVYARNGHTRKIKVTVK